MPRLPTPHGAALRTATRRSSWIWWVGAVSCAAVLGAALVASRTDEVELRALSADGAAPEPLSAPSFELHGEAASTGPGRRAVSGDVPDAATAPIPAPPPASDAAVLVAGRVVVASEPGAEVAPVAEARLYVETRRRSTDGRLGTWATTPLRTVSDHTGNFTIAQPAEGTPGAKALASSTRSGQGLDGLRVRARAFGHIDAYAAFERGATGLELAVTRGGSVAVRIVHGEAEHDPRFSLALTVGDERFERAKVTDERETFRSVPPGEASLTVWLAGDPEPLAVLRGLVVPPGARCADPRLDPLDVSERVATYSVHVVNDRGEVVPQPIFRIVGGAAPVEDVPRSSVRTLVDGEARGSLGEGWWHVLARVPAPDAVVSAVDHDSSEALTLIDGATITLRSEPRFFIELARDPPPGDVWIQLEAPSAPDPASPARRASRVIRWPTYFGTGQGRARLVTYAPYVASQRQPREVTAGPWVEFEVPESGEGRVVLDLTF